MARGEVEKMDSAAVVGNAPGSHAGKAGGRLADGLPPLGLAAGQPYGFEQIRPAPMRPFRALPTAGMAAAAQIGRAHV